MADKTKIEWTDATWNPLRGCSRISTGCGGPNDQGGCYAEQIAARFSGPGQPFEGLAHRVDGVGRWTGKLTMAPDKVLLQPLRWKKLRRIFVNSMSDLFHENVPDEWIDRIFAVMAMAPQHTFQVLTKRPQRMREYLCRASSRFNIAHASPLLDPLYFDTHDWPLPTVWLGVSVENQAAADERIPELLQTPAAVRFLSCEPLLGPLDITQWLHDSTCQWRMGYCTCSEPREYHVDWVIAGGESGPNARPAHPEWFRDLRDECRGSSIPYFFKQWGEWTPGENVKRTKGPVNTAFLDDDGDWLFEHENLANTDGHIDDQPDLYRVGKKAAGRLLDGIEHNGMPGDRAQRDASNTPGDGAKTMGDF